MSASPQDAHAAALTDSTEIDAVALVVRGCAGVSALVGGPFGEVTSYLPGRVVPGVTVDDGRIRVRVRSEWGVSAPALAALITAALAPLAGSRPVDVTIADIDDPPPASPGGGSLSSGLARPGAVTEQAGRGSARSATRR